MSPSPYEIKIVKQCPICGWRIFDKVTPTTGIIEIKCPSCRQVVQIDLSYRISRPSIRSIHNHIA